jgi:hypothetical protein
MEETLLNLWELFVLVAGGGFVLAYLWESLFPSRDEPTYYWETDGYLPNYLPPPDDDGVKS